MMSLKSVRFPSCSLNGTLPITEGICNLRNLEELDLSENELSGTLPWCIGNLTSLQKLNLSDNHFIGSISPLRGLTSLEELKVSNNLFQVPLSLEPFFNHSKLKYLYGDGNQIYNEHPEVHGSTPKFQLEILQLSSQGNGTGNGGGLPEFVRHQHDLQQLSLFNIQIQGEFPPWLLENNTKLADLILVGTSLLGPLHLPTHPRKGLWYLDISDNDLNGTIPVEVGQVLPNLQYLNLSRNYLSGGMPSSIFSKMFSMLEVLDLSYNNLSGEIPGDLEIGDEVRLENNKLQILDASNNHLSGSIPGWILNISSLKLLDLSENNFDRILPTCIITSYISLVYLSGNMLQGPVGDTFSNCSNMVLLDLSRNNFSGTIPKWIGKLPYLSYLLMSHNNLEGEIPVEFCNLEQLSLIDLSHNNLSGHVLSCIRSLENHFAPIDMGQPLEFTTKGITYSIQISILEYMAGIDLSSNNLSGTIPIEIGNLSMIQVLNFSHNNLIGPIPESFSNLAQVESLDLSYNKLYGKIPSQLLKLPYISDFRVAHNNLSGRTPERVAQFATFESSSYEGNPYLCGPPLLQNCSSGVPPSPNYTEEEDDRFMDMDVFYVSCVVTYFVVLCSFGVVLYVNPYWRRRWFYMIELMLRNCYYFIEDHVLFPLFKLRAS
ncbi:receptor like protein 15 [Euphorbia peplus]|nr:receptor like protein 15 [Euphorbia peplus]